MVDSFPPRCESVPATSGRTVNHFSRLSCINKQTSDTKTVCWRSSEVPQRTRTNQESTVAKGWE